MDKYKIFETDEFLKKIRKFSRQDADFVQKKLREYVYPQIKMEPFLGRNIKNSAIMNRRYGATEQANSESFILSILKKR